MAGVAARTVLQSDVNQAEYSMELRMRAPSNGQISFLMIVSGG
jgi:hypothetical protein